MKPHYFRRVNKRYENLFKKIIRALKDHESRLTKLENIGTDYILKHEKMLTGDLPKSAWPFPVISTLSSHHSRLSALEGVPLQIKTSFLESTGEVFPPGVEGGSFPQHITLAFLESTGEIFPPDVEVV